jgi:hypothetical protein
MSLEDRVGNLERAIERMMETNLRHARSAVQTNNVIERNNHFIERTEAKMRDDMRIQIERLTELLVALQDAIEKPGTPKAILTAMREAFHQYGWQPSSATIPPRIP